jgi:acyl carrier protein
VQNLVCYYVEKEGYNINEEALKAWIGETLTAFMVPEFYVKMDKLPFTPNGKVNRRELPIPEAKEVEIVAPETETEKKLYDIAIEMLKADKLGVTTSLISYGLTSLTAMRLSALLQQRLMVAIPVADLLSHPTIREIAEYIDSGQAKSTKVADIFTKRTPQTSEGTSEQKGNPLQAKGNPLQAKGNPLQAKSNPFAPKKNPLQSDDNNNK